MENEEEIKEVEEEVEAEEETEEDYECNGFLQMPNIDLDLSVELPTAADLLGLNDEE